MGSYEDWSSREVAPYIRQQELRIRQQRELIEQLETSGHSELSKEARAFLRDMCSALIDMRLEERRQTIRSREESFAPRTQEQTLTRVMRECPL
jgi:hypothetical protein